MRATSSRQRKSSSDRLSIAKYVILDHFEDGQILIHDPVKDRVEDVIDAFSKLGGRTLELLSKVAQCTSVAVANGDKMIMASKYRRLAVTYSVPDQLSRLGDDVSSPL